jgi:hypothetical protein
MKRLLVMVLVVACNKPDTQTTSASASVSAATPTPTAPFTGTLTGDRVMGAKSLARPFQPWADAQMKLEGAMGKETYTKGDKHYWGVLQGDDCFYMVVEKQKDGTVGMVQDPSKVSKNGAIMNLDECLTAAGARKEAAEDPNAPGPPTDGKPIALASLIDGASKARSKWTGAKVSATALYLSTSTSTSGADTFTTLSLTPAKGDLKNTVRCSLADAKATLPKLVQYDPVTVTGTVKVDDMLSLAGTRSTSVGLDACTVKGK